MCGTCFLDKHSLWKPDGLTGCGRLIVPYSQKTPPNHAAQKVQIFLFILRTLVNLPRPTRICVSEKHQVSEGRHITEAMCAIPSTVVELVGVPRPNSGAGCRVGGPKSAEFLLHMLKNAVSNAELKGLDVDTLATEHIQEQSSRDAAQNLQNSREGKPIHELAMPQ